MQKPIISFLLIFAIISCNDAKNKQSEISEKSNITTYYLIRHAEKDRSNPSNKNPGLTELGIARAKNWATYFENIPFDEIYSTDYSRTRQTASYTANKKNIKVQIYDPENLYSSEFKTATQNRNVLIVGHSNTTPQFVNAIIGENKYDDIADDENGLLYIVTIDKEVKNVEILTIN